jgi:hypothetical protein
MPIFLLPYLYSQLVLASFSGAWVDTQKPLAGE